MGARISVSTAVVVAVLLIVVAIMTGYAVRAAVVGRRPDPRLERFGGGSAFFGAWLMEAFYWAMRRPGAACARLGVRPDTLTWLSLALTGASFPATALGHFSIAGLLFLAGAACDALDGMVARETGQASAAGELLDSVMDRYADAAPLFGLCVYYRFSAWLMCIPLAAFLGSMMLSYNRAKAEALGLQLKSGAMRRHERIAYIGAGLIIGPELTPWLGAPAGIAHPALLAPVALVAVAANIAALRLAAAARLALRERAAGGRA